jgi:hypothetical protein
MQHSRKHLRRSHKAGTKGYRKGSKSKTMKGKKDFTTKKSSKVFNRRGHYQKHAKGSHKTRKPYRKGGMLSGLASKMNKMKDVSKLSGLAASQMKNMGKLSGLAASQMKDVSKLSGLAASHMKKNMGNLSGLAPKSLAASQMKDVSKLSGLAASQMKKNMGKLSGLASKFGKSS